MTDIQNAAPAQSGAEVFIPLDRLKKSPKNARKTPHRPEDIAALAASIHAKGLLQPPVVEPEVDEAGAPTGHFLVTIGEGRRQAQLLRVKQKRIKKTEPIRCRIDTENDAYEISLDENVTRFAMHPADQFEAFQRLAQERGFGPEEIAARFGVTAAVVRQRLKLASVSPRLIQTYRDDGMSLEQVMAFTLTDDHARQEGLWESLPQWDRDPQAIRRHLTRDRVRATDIRAVFVGVEAYQEAGGVIERDLFTDDRGGYFADPTLLDRLVREKLERLAAEALADGWKWVAFEPDYGLARLTPEVRDPTAEEDERLAELVGEREALQEGHDEWDDEAEARWTQIEAEVQALQAARRGFSPEAKARAGGFITVGRDGRAVVDLGYVRAEDLPSEDGVSPDHSDEEPVPVAKSKEPGRSPLSDKLVADLTAHRTLALQDALAQNPDVAFVEVLHLLTAASFGRRHETATCLQLRTDAPFLDRHAPGIAESRAGCAVRERHEAWETRITETGGDLRTFVAGLSRNEAMALLAHCVSLTVNGVEMTDRGSWGAGRPGDALAIALSLDMSAYWTPTAETYFSRVSKGRILEAVTEAISEDAARRLGTAKKADMAEAAEQLVAGTGWLPEPLRTDLAVKEEVPLAAE
jgi:ParB family transcriptional regulator, chromosome partitioning protein